MNILTDLLNADMPSNLNWLDDISKWIYDNPSYYWGIMFGTMIVSMMLMVFVQKKFHGTFNKYSKQNSGTGLTGAQIAQQILDKNGISYINVVKGSREGQDHFNPAKNVIMLSPSNYDSTSTAAIAVAAHEVGHAIQWHSNWIGIKIRNLFLVPAQIGSQLGWISIFVGLMSTGFWGGSSNFGMYALLTGFVLVAFISVFQIVTLPVEFDASARALKILKTDGYITAGSEEHSAAKKVLTAAAWTYVVGVLISLLELFRLLIIIAARNRR